MALKLQPFLQKQSQRRIIFHNKNPHFYVSQGIPKSSICSSIRPSRYQSAGVLLPWCIRADLTSAVCTFLHTQFQNGNPPEPNYVPERNMPCAEAANLKPLLLPKSNKQRPYQLES